MSGNLCKVAFQKYENLKEYRQYLKDVRNLEAWRRKKPNLNNNPLYNMINEKYHPPVFCKECNVKMKYVGKKVPTVEHEAPLLAYQCPNCKKVKADRFYYFPIPLGDIHL